MCSGARSHRVGKLFIHHWGKCQLCRDGSHSELPHRFCSRNVSQQVNATQLTFVFLMLKSQRHVGFQRGCKHWSNLRYTGTGFAIPLMTWGAVLSQVAKNECATNEGHGPKQLCQRIYNASSKEQRGGEVWGQSYWHGFKCVLPFLTFHRLLENFSAEKQTPTESSGDVFTGGSSQEALEEISDWWHQQSNYNVLAEYWIFFFVPDFHSNPFSWVEKTNKNKRSDPTKTKERLMK